MCIGIAYANGQVLSRVVADSLSRSPLPSASVFNHKGDFIGMSRTNGKITCASAADYPITVRYLGYHERTIPYGYGRDTIFLIANVSELPEVLIESKAQRMLHILAYGREYSTLTSYTDTITMFREKMVDFMLPTDAKTRVKGWRNPRVLNARSYYRFTNANGLDSVSDRCNHYFSWSDWVGMIPTTQLPPSISKVESGTDTVFGKYLPAEIWIKNGNRLAIDVNVMADSASRRWVPGISHFFNKDDTDFEQFRFRANYDNVISGEASPLDLTGYSYSIESRGRGRGMFQFTRYGQPFFVTTYAEVYILDKEYITIKEAKEWEARKFSPDDVEIFEPADAPDLTPATLALIDRVNNIDADQVRLSLKPDERYVGRKVRKNHMGSRVLSLLKQLTGISSYKTRKNLNRRWNEYRDINKRPSHSPRRGD